MTKVDWKHGRGEWPNPPHFESGPGKSFTLSSRGKPTVAAFLAQLERDYPELVKNARRDRGQPWLEQWARRLLDAGR